MSTRVTITLPEDQLKQIRTRVTDKRFDSISAFIQQAVQKSLDGLFVLEPMIEEDPNPTRAPSTPKERE